MQMIDRSERITLLGKDEGGLPFTLADGFLMSYSHSGPEKSSATFHFNYAFRGAHFKDETSAILTELSIRIPTVAHWLETSGLAFELAQSRRAVDIRFSQPADLEFELEPGLKLVFGFDWTLQPARFEASLAQRTWLILQASPARTFIQLRTTAHRVLNLLSLLVGEPLGYESFFGKTPAKGGERRGESTALEVLFAPISPELVDSVVESHRMLVRFKDLQDAHPNVFRCWLKKYETFCSSFDSYFAVQRRDPGYQEQRFLSIVQSLESFHRLGNEAEPSGDHQERLDRIETRLEPKDWKWLKRNLRPSEPNLAQRLRELLEPFGDLFGSPEDRRLLADKTADTRNYLTHYDPRMKEKAVAPARLWPYLYRLRILFSLCCLLEIGFTVDEARRFIEKNNRMRQMVRFGKL